MDFISKFDDCNDVDDRHTSVLLQGISVIDKQKTTNIIMTFGTMYNI